jgi:hypothetical protein
MQMAPKPAKIATLFWFWRGSWAAFVERLSEFLVALVKWMPFFVGLEQLFAFSPGFRTNPPAAGCSAPFGRCG